MVTIMHGEWYRLESYGNGLAYALLDCANSSSVFVQGEDAAQMRNEIDAIEAVHPDWSPDDVLAYLWDQCDYGSVAS